MPRLTPSRAPIKREKRDERLDLMHNVNNSEEKARVYKTFVEKVEKLKKEIEAGENPEKIERLRRIVGENAWSAANYGYDLSEYDLEKLGCQVISPNMCKQIGRGGK